MRDDGSSDQLRGVGGPGRRTWQKMGWWILAAFVLAGAAGAFGNGPLSRTSISRGDIRIDYERVVRLRAPTEIRVSVEPAAPARVQLSVELEDPADFLLDGVTPEPLRARASERGHVYEMATHGGEVHFAVRGVPRKLGRSEMRLAIGDDDPIAIRQLVLP